MNTEQKQINWMIGFGVMPIPTESMYQEIKKTEEATYKPVKRTKSKGTEKRDWNKIRCATDKMESEIKLLLESEKVITPPEAYEILNEKGMIPQSIYSEKMGLSRFKFYYHKVKKEHGLPDWRRYSVSFIKDNYEKMSNEDLATYLCVKERYVRQTISAIKRGDK